MPVTPQRLRDALNRVTDQTSFIQELLIDALDWEIPTKAERIKELGYEWYLRDDFGFTRFVKRHAKLTPIEG